MDKYGATEFTLRFRMNNAAFEDDRSDEVRRILLDLADAIHGTMDPEGGGGDIRDYNGNTIGSYWYDAAPDHEEPEPDEEN